MLNIRFAVALLLVFIAFCISFVGGVLTKNIAMQLLDITTLVATAADSSQTVSAAQSLASLWDEKNQILSLFLDNSRCEQLGNLIAQVYSAVGEEESDACNTACMQLAQQLKAIIEQEKLSLYNLF
ncbi:MAG: DUF4363 family protein [Ruminococcaceae bacterium]|nr:DUF4363 family protein [Oscillospiraceae bacterium]